MPIAFGSVGDIISLCLLIKDAVAALNDCAGSAHKYQQLLRELASLERVLLEVEQLICKHKASPSLNALCVAAQETADGCRQSIEPFLKKVKKYSQSLKPGGSGNVFKDAARKVQWTLQKDEVDRFYAEIAAHGGSLNMLLITWSITTTECCSKKTQRALDAANELETASHRTQEGLLNRILIRLNNSVKISTCANTMLQKALSSGSALITMMSRIQKTTFRTYQAVLSIQSSLCSITAQCRLIETPCVLTDSLGRRTPISLQFIDSWAALEAVLEIRFENLHGHQKVLNKEYALQDSKNGLDLVQTRPWRGQVVPGQDIVMDMIFRPENKLYSKGQCPSCDRVYEMSTDNVDCSACGLHFSNVVDQFLVPDSNMIDPECDLEAVSGHFSAAMNKKRKRPAEALEVDLPRHFKRVRLCLIEEMQGSRISSDKSCNADRRHSFWGCSANREKKKRVLVVWDGQRRLGKDDMVLSNDFEVRIPPAGIYVTEFAAAEKEKEPRAEFMTNIPNASTGYIEFG